jgi:hypothetical protein
MEVYMSLGNEAEHMAEGKHGEAASVERTYSRFAAMSLSKTSFVVNRFDARLLFHFAGLLGIACRGSAPLGVLEAA